MRRTGTPVFGVSGRNVRDTGEKMICCGSDCVARWTFSKGKILAVIFCGSARVLVQHQRDGSNMKPAANRPPFRPGAKASRLRSRQSQGFTLIELLVVIASIVILAGLLLPSLTRSKDSARTAACLSNLKQLQVCWQLYSIDNDDSLPLNNFYYSAETGTEAENSYSWCPGNVRTDITTTNIERGLLFQYNTTTAIYHCPADPSQVAGADGAPSGLPRTRSYNMSLSINCDANPSYRTFSDFRSTSPSQIFVFIDVHEDAIIDATFGIYPAESGYGNYWIDLPADRHNRGANLSFADGHVEHWRWRTSKRFIKWIQPPADELDEADLRRLQACIYAEPPAE